MNFVVFLAEMAIFEKMFSLREPLLSHSYEAFIN